MIRKGFPIVLAVLGLAGFCLQASGHHSFSAAYNTQVPITLQGKLLRVRLTNPHSHFFIEVEDEDGNPVEWKVEAGTPGAMIRHGYSPEVIRQGDMVTIRGFQARNDSPNAMLRELETSDGTVWGMFAPVEGPGAR